MSGRRDGAGGPHPDGRERLIVTVDGPAGVGKSSVASAAARALGLEFLDTGAMYRAATALALDQGVPIDDPKAVADLALRAALHFDWTTDPPTLLAFDRSIMGRLRQPDVDAAVSAVSGLAALREVMVHLQRAIGDRHPRLVSEGRDQGSVVFPGADVKIYLDASPRSRAERRASQRRAMGMETDVVAVERELFERDKRDSARAIAPLVCPHDAMRIDTSRMTFDEVVAAVVRAVRGAVGVRAGSGR